MTQQWRAQKDSLEIANMPFYWRLSHGEAPPPGIESCLDIRVTRDADFDYLCYRPDARQWAIIEKAYHQDATIGFLFPGSGQLNTYGSSVNRFFLSVISERQPKYIYEIGCGAGFSILFLKENGWEVTGIDPSEYSLQSSRKYGFRLINSFFSPDAVERRVDLIYCNDVFEHVPDVVSFSRHVQRTLNHGGAFCFATTNSTASIKCGDISMFEHQHINMFTERSIHLILRAAGFDKVIIGRGSYGNTFHVIAQKGAAAGPVDLPAPLTGEFFGKAADVVGAFGRLYERASIRHGYVPLRCIPYLATVGDRGCTYLYDSNVTWRGKFIDGYGTPIRSYEDVYADADSFFIGSMTFEAEIREMLLKKGVRANRIFSVGDLR